MNAQSSKARIEKPRPVAPHENAKWIELMAPTPTIDLPGSCPRGVSAASRAAFTDPAAQVSEAVYVRGSPPLASAPWN